MTRNWYGMQFQAWLPVEMSVCVTKEIEGNDH